jgi:hypothetical protein
MDQFLYLSAYPFGNQREPVRCPVYTYYAVPEGYVPNRALATAIHSGVTRTKESERWRRPSNQQPVIDIRPGANVARTQQTRETSTGQTCPIWPKRRPMQKKNCFASLNQATQEQVRGQIALDKHAEEIL